MLFKDCKDSFSYCSSIVPSDCYALGEKCCRTCTKYLINIPGMTMLCFWFTTMFNLRSHRFHTSSTLQLSASFQAYEQKHLLLASNKKMLISTTQDNSALCLVGNVFLELIYQDHCQKSPYLTSK